MNIIINIKCTDEHCAECQYLAEKQYCSLWGSKLNRDHGQTYRSTMCRAQEADKWLMAKLRG